MRPTIVAAGWATLVAGTVTVACPQIGANDLVLLTNNTLGGTAGTLEVGTIVAGTSFVINSSAGADTSKVGYVVVNVEE